MVTTKDEPTIRHEFSDREHAALLMLSYACNGAATAMCGGSEVLAGLNAAICALVMGDTHHAVEVLRMMHEGLAASKREGQ